VETAQARIRSLEEERDKLTAAVAMKKKPGAIRERAQQELGMIDPGLSQARNDHVHSR
jgi:cell division protein FtsB